MLSVEDNEIITDVYYPQEEPIEPGCHHLGHEPSYKPRIKIPHQLIVERGRKLASKLLTVFAV